MPLYQALILGIVQGLTEFLPVSSTAHLILVPWLFGWQDPGLAFDMALHVGTLLAVASYFRADLANVVRGALRTLRAPDLRGDPDQKLAWMLVLGTIPAAVVGLLFKRHIETTLRSPLVIAFALIGVGLWILLAEALAKRSRGLAAAGFLDALLVGCGQALAVIPGVSRSGATIAAGLAVGLTREAAARLSFLIGFPTIHAACALKLKDVLEAAPGGPAFDWTAAAAGTAAAAISGYACIAGLLAFIQRRSFAVFVVYRIALGATLIYLIRFAGFQGTQSL